MRVVYGGIAYDTDKATKLVGGDNSPWSDAWWGLYRTPAGAYFKIIVDHNGESFLECKTLTDEEARTCLEKEANHLVEKYFGPMPEPGFSQYQSAAVTSSTTSSIRGERPNELLVLKPSIWGLSIDLKELGRRARSWWQRRAP